MLEVVYLTPFLIFFLSELRNSAEELLASVEFMTKTKASFLIWVNIDVWIVARDHFRQNTDLSFIF